MDINNLKKKLLFRSTHRGCKETDFLIGDFAVAMIDTLNQNELLEYQLILELNDIDLYNWITGKEEIPSDINNHTLQKIISFNKTRNYE